MEVTLKIDTNTSTTEQLLVASKMLESLAAISAVTEIKGESAQTKTPETPKAKTASKAKIAEAAPAEAAPAEAPVNEPEKLRAEVLGVATDLIATKPENRELIRAKINFPGGSKVANVPAEWLPALRDYLATLK